MVDNEMQRLLHLGIVKELMLPYYSPTMLIARKNSNLKGITTDFRNFEQ